MKRILLLFLLAVPLAGCGQKSADLQEGAVAPDTTLFENGMKYLDKGQYIKARLAFQTLINTYPDSEWTPVAFLANADSFYEEGGKDNLLQAEASYKDFIIFYPTHEMADDAQMKIVAINYRLMKPADRDATYARKTEAEAQRFLDNFPDSEMGSTCRQVLAEVREVLAESNQGVANFYFDKGSFLAAESRYTEVYEKYPNFSRMDETLYKLAGSLERLGRIEEASVYYARIAEGYPFSQYFKGAREKLIMLEHPGGVPEVNAELAAQNEANLPQEGFSLLDPFRDVWQAFAGRPDPYEMARQRAGQQQSNTNQSQTTPAGEENPQP